MSAFRTLDVDAELQKLRHPPAKVAKAAKVEGKISQISHFSRPIPENLKNLQTRYGERAEAVAPSEPEAWPCYKCGHPAIIESIEPSRDGERMLTFWHCPPCQSYAVTPDTVKEPPRGWATKTQH